MGEPELAHRRRRPLALHRPSDHRLEGAEVGVVEELSALQSGDEAQDLPILPARRTDDELARRPGRPGSAGRAVIVRRAEQTPRKLEVRKQVAGRGLGQNPEHVMSISRQIF